MTLAVGTGGHDLERLTLLRLGLILPGFPTRSIHVHVVRLPPSREHIFEVFL